MRNFVYGAGGHGKVVRDTLRALATEIGDEDVAKGMPPLEFDCVYVDEAKEIEDIILPAEIPYGARVVMGIGDNLIREKCVEKLKNMNKKFIFPYIKHPQAYISRGARIKEGIVVFVNAAVQPGSKLGKFCIINTGATVDHDCILGNYVHIAPGVSLCGNVTVGDYTLVGVGSSVIPNIKIGKNTIIGAGSVVVSDIPDGVVAYGNPCKIIKEIE